MNYETQRSFFQVLAGFCIIFALVTAAIYIKEGNIRGAMWPFITSIWIMVAIVADKIILKYRALVDDSQATARRILDTATQAMDFIAVLQEENKSLRKSKEE